jgi:teichuronic acid biosynthesis glycosyltransferase TuaH
MIKNAEHDSLTGETILFLSLPKHDSHYTSTAWQLASEMAKDNEVIFVDQPYSFTDLLTSFFKAPVKKRLKALLRKTWFRKENVTVLLSPFVWPINFLPKGKIYDFFYAWNHRILARRINRYLKDHQIEELVFVNSFDFYFADLPDYLRADLRLNIYHCIDPMIKSFTLKHGRYLQQRVSMNSDLVISTAPALQQSFVQAGINKSYLVPNAANFELFNSARRCVGSHERLSKISGKVMGYLGNIERRIDYNLLMSVLELLPDWQIVMAGPVERQYVPVEFSNHSRVHLIGPVPHHEAPAVIAGFDVAIIPFKSDEVSSGIYPLKLFEYLATGKPVVSTDFNPEVLENVSHVAARASDVKDFARAVERSYTTDSTELQLKRVHVASENTWEHRARLFKSIISVELKNKYRLSYVA